jgi:hypothetical protein
LLFVRRFIEMVSLLGRIDTSLQFFMSTYGHDVLGWLPSSPFQSLLYYFIIISLLHFDA